MKIQAPIVALVLSVLSVSPVAQAVDFSQVGACFITTEQGTTCSLATYGSCIANNSREYDVTADWRVGTCPSESQEQSFN